MVGKLRTNPYADGFRRREFLSGMVALTAASLVTGCGSMMYPERIGQPRGPLDWRVVALDALGLVFFFVPGVIAFAVDFYNGTIYLPPNTFAASGEPFMLNRQVPLTHNQRNLSGIQEVVSREADIELDLQPGTYLTRNLASLADAPRAASELERDWNLLAEPPA